MITHKTITRLHITSTKITPPKNNAQITHKRQRTQKTHKTKQHTHQHTRQTNHKHTATKDTQSQTKRN